MATITIGRVLDSTTDSTTVVQGAAGAAGWLTKEQNVLVPEEYDFVALSYTGSNLTTIVFRTGGSGGTIVATLVLAYTGSRLDSVTRT